MWLLIPILVYSVIFIYVRHVYSHWRRKGFPHEKSNLYWSYLKKVYNREFNYVQAVSQAYQTDLSLACLILENQSGYFNDPKWDYVRSYRKFNLLEKLSPIFSSPRLEAMFYNIEKVGNHMLNHLNNMASSVEGDGSDGIDMQHMLRIYSVNVIANLIYGLDIDVFKQTDSIFQQYINSYIRQTAVHSYTLKHFPKKSSLTYRLCDIIRENVERREEFGIIRKDILQLLIKFRNANEIEHRRDKLNWHIENVFEREKLLSIKKLAHITEYLLEKCMGTMASTAVFTLYEILQQGELKTKVLEELNTYKCDNNEQQITCENLKQLKLMDLCIQETLRKYPSVPLIERVCRKPFPIPESKHILSEGKTLIIPLLAIQRDEKYFDDPLGYKPQRFIPDSNGNQGEKFIGFGLGAKTFMAQNFVKLAVKYILVKLLLNYNMDLVPTEDFDICYNNTPYIQSKDGFKVKLKYKIKFDL